MKYVKDYDLFLNEELKYTAFIILNDMVPKIKRVRDLIWGKKLDQKKLGVLPPLVKISAGLGITISLIYLMMWYHNKQLDKVQPEIEEKLKKYQKLLDSEFTPKEQDNFIRIIASDKKVLDSVIAVLNGNKSPEHLKYIESRFTKDQIEKINRLATKIDTHEKTNESLNEAEWFEILGLKRSDVLHIKNVRDIKNDIKIKSAWLGKAKELHPDKNAHDPNANKNFIDLKNAYDKGVGTNNPMYDIGTKELNMRDIADTSRKDPKYVMTAKFFSWEHLGIIIKQMIIDVLLESSIVFILSKNKYKNINDLKSLDKSYQSNIEILSFLFDNLFNDQEKKELEHYFENDLEYINYIQRIDRLSNLNDRKRLSDVISEHLAEKMPQKLFKKYKVFIKIGEDNNLFTKGSVTPHSLAKTYGAKYTMDMLKQHILPEIKFYH